MLFDFSTYVFQVYWDWVIFANHAFFFLSSSPAPVTCPLYLLPEWNMKLAACRWCPNFFALPSWSGSDPLLPHQFLYLFPNSSRSVNTLLLLQCIPFPSNHLPFFLVSSYASFKTQLKCGISRLTLKGLPPLPADRVDHPFHWAITAPLWVSLS